MKVNGLVVTLGNDEQINEQLLKQLESEPTFELGERNANRVPIVFESEEGKSAQQLHDWLVSLSGVKHVEVVFVGFDDA